jgi:hypothetical protein
VGKVADPVVACGQVHQAPAVGHSRTLREDSYHDVCCWAVRYYLMPCGLVSNTVLAGFGVTSAWEHSRQCMRRGSIE